MFLLEIQTFSSIFSPLQQETIYLFYLKVLK